MDRLINKTEYIYLLLGPTLMIFIGLQLIGSVLITFLLFYGWLLLIPILSKDYSIKDTEWKCTQHSIWVGILSGLLFFLFIFGGMYWLHQYFIDINQLQGLLMKWGFTGNAVIGLIFVLLVVNPLLEEIYWRGFMLKKLKAKVNVFYAIMITSFFYTLYHLLSVLPMFQFPLSIVAVLPVFVAGIIWGYMRIKINSKIGIVISHALGDLGIIFVYLFIIR